MKGVRVFIMPLLVFLFAPSAFAELGGVELQKSVTLTQGRLLLNQVDVLCLYFSSGQVAYAPVHVGGKVIDIEATVLDPQLIKHPEKTRRFVSRQVKVFVDQLKERLELYTPSLSKRFDTRRDIRFTINVGDKRQLLAVWEKGGWSWVKPLAGSAGAFAISGPSPRVKISLNEARGTSGRDKRAKWSSCPSLRPDE